MALGAVVPSTILRKLASYPRQNDLALALREVGRVERSLFLARVGSLTPICNAALSWASTRARPTTPSSAPSASGAAARSATEARRASITAWPA